MLSANTPSSSVLRWSRWHAFSGKGCSSRYSCVDCLSVWREADVRFPVHDNRKECWVVISPPPLSLFSFLSADSDLKGILGYHPVSKEQVICDDVIKFISFRHFVIGPSASLRHQSVVVGPSASLRHQSVVVGPFASLGHQSVVIGPFASLRHQSVVVGPFASLGHQSVVVGPFASLGHQSVVVYQSLKGSHILSYLLPKFLAIDW